MHRYLALVSFRIFIPLLTLLLPIISLAQEWKTVGDIYNANESVFMTINDFWVEGDSLIIGGGFDQVGYQGDTLNVRGIMVWDSLDLSGVYGDSPNAIAVFEEQLYIGGPIGFEVDANSVAGYDGQEWFELNGGGTGATSNVYDLEVFDNKLFACGNFGNMGGLDNAGIGAWNGSMWIDVGEIVGAGPPFCMEVFQGDLYVGGDHNQCSPPDIACPSIGRFDGEQWHDLNGGATGAVWAMTVDEENDLLYVGGWLTNVGGGEIDLESVAAWDGQNWQQVADIGFNSNVKGMAMYRGQLYVVGGFWEFSDGTPINHIARFDGVNWQSVDGGANSSCRALVVYKDELYVGGSFTEIGGIEANTLARYYLHPDSVTWGVPDTTINILENTAGLKESFTVFPNPSSGIFHLKFETGSDLPIVVTDMNGRQVFYDNSGWRESLELDLVNQPAGQYLVSKIQHGSLVGTTRIIKR